MRLASIAAALAMLASPCVAQTSVQQLARPTRCGTVCGAAAGTVLYNTAPGAIEGLNIVNGATAGFAVLYDSATIPADGALDATLIRFCLPIAANTGLQAQFRTPVQVYNGATFFVSSNSCTTKAAVTYAFVNAQARGQ